ncbi:patatin-like phospholipase family protein [Salinivibrio socompensis]|uniref:patatin-like phospholipase family protein n=2 Tax=Salinivibrio socompensis TaxID=1510206 RepID=UPI0004720629|nr:patatin family protein [Salinivibrio socompensis]
MTTRQKALVVEGGAMRGIFAAGVLDQFIESAFYDFHFCVGVSAGSTNLIGYLSGSYSRSKRIILNYATSAEFFSFKRYLKGGHLCDVSWLWHASFDAEPLSQALRCPLWVVTTSVETGQPHYFCMDKAGFNHEAIVASCSIPLAYRDYPNVDGISMTDGGIADSIPVKFAYQQGARDITVILSRPLGYRKKNTRSIRLLKPVIRHAPALFEAMNHRHRRYNDALDFIHHPPADCTIKVIAPNETFRVGRFTMNKAYLEAGYDLGRELGKKHINEETCS